MSTKAEQIITTRSYQLMVNLMQFHSKQEAKKIRSRKRKMKHMINAHGSQTKTQKNDDNLKK